MYINKDGELQDQEHLVASFIISLFLLPVNHLKLERNLAHLEFDGTLLWIFLSKNVRLALKIRKSIDNKIKLAIIISVVVRSLERSRNLSPRSYSRSSKVFCKRHKWRTNRWEIFHRRNFSTCTSKRWTLPKAISKNRKKGKHYFSLVNLFIRLWIRFRPANFARVESPLFAESLWRRYWVIW